MSKTIPVLLALAMLLPIGVIDAAPAAAAGGTTCSAFAGRATLTPALPKYGSTDLVRPTVTVKRAKLSSCSGGVTGGTVSATLRLAKASNCTTLITQTTKNIAETAKGTLTITWNNRKTSTITFSLSFGSVAGNPTLAKISGKVTAGRFDGMKGTGTVSWSLDSDECFGGAPLSSLALSEFAPFVLK